MATRRRRGKGSPLDNISNIVTAAALVVIAVLLVVFVALYIRNNLSLSGVLPGDETESESESESESEPAEEGYGLTTLSDGRLVYAMTAREASSYDSDELIAEGEGRYLLADSWLDLDEGLYHFDEEGTAAVGRDYSERAFVYSFDEEGRLSEISYNPRYTAPSVTGYEDYEGLLQTKSLWAYMDSSHKIGDYTSLMYKKTTETSSYALGSESSRQYASPCAYEIIGKNIYYLAVEGASGLAGSALTDTIEGKVFSMGAGADTRYVWAEGSYGFKALTGLDGSTVVYSYDGSRVHRETSSAKDDSMIVFTEDLSYKVSLSDDLSHAYLELDTGQRVTMESSSFKAGNFTYSLAGDGEILSVAAKTTVNTGGYTYLIQHGTSFGAPRSRVIRQSADGSDMVISSEFEGTTSNLHYDYDSSSMIAEYTFATGGGGLLRISLDGDVDIITEAYSFSAPVTLYALQDSVAVIGTAGGFYTARLDITTPLAVAVDPEPATGGAEVSETPAETSSAPAETSSAPTTDTSIGSGPSGDADSGSVIYASPTEAAQGPGG